MIKRAGAKVTTFGRSTKVSVSWSEPLPPPPPPPPPAATPGHFAGTIGNAASPIMFDTLDYNLKFTAKVTGGTAARIVHVESSYLLSDGNRLNCSSSDQPWTATRAG